MKSIDPLVVLFVIVGCVLAYVLFDIPDVLLSPASDLTGADRIEAETKIRTTILQFAALCGAAITVYLAFRRVRAMERRNELQDGDIRQARERNSEQILLQRQGQLDDRYTRAVELLASAANTGARTGGIFALERIARENPSYHWQAMEMLCAYVVEVSKTTREKYPQDDDKTVQQPSEVRVIMEVLGRRLIGFDADEIEDREAGKRLNLRAADLRNLDLTGANLARANLTAVDFRGSLLNRADLRDTKLLATKFPKYMRHADLRGVDVRAEFDGTDLDGVRLEGADLRHSGLDKAQLLKAWVDGNTISPAGLLAPDWWREVLAASAEREGKWKALAEQGRLPEERQRALEARQD